VSGATAVISDDVFAARMRALEHALGASA